MRKYPKYKATGLDGFDNVPENWQIIKLKYIAKIYNGQDQKDVLDENGKYPIYGSGGIFGYANNYLSEGPSVLLGRKGTVNKPRLVETPFWSVDTAYYTKISKKVAPVLFYHLCNQINFDYFIYGSAVPSMTARDLNEIKFALPPLPEQNSIVQFLDHKTDQIDRFIANRRKQIELLKEQKAAIINKAVTKGINPSAKMKDSGIEWIGEVPEHWEIWTIAKLAKKLCNGFVGQTNNILEETGVRYIQSLHIKENQIRFIKPFFVSEKWSKEHARSILKSGDVLIVQTGDVGQVSCVSSEFEGCNCHALIIFQVKKKMAYGEYMSTLLSSNFGVSELRSYQTGTVLPHLNVGSIKYIKLTVPPKNEQLEILEYLKTETEIIDTLITKYQKQIDLMQEYRTALISQAVTGKIDVRDWKPKAKNYKTEEMYIGMAAEKPETYN